MCHHDEHTHHHGLANGHQTGVSGDETAECPVMPGNQVVRTGIGPEGFAAQGQSFSARRSRHGPARPWVLHTVSRSDPGVHLVLEETFWSATWPGCSDQGLVPWRTLEHGSRISGEAYAVVNPFAGLPTLVATIGMDLCQGDRIFAGRSFDRIPGRSGRGRLCVRSVRGGRWRRRLL